MYFLIDWVFLKIVVKNCIVGMLLTCPIKIAWPVIRFEPQQNMCGYIHEPVKI